ncbi:2-oxo acid dehydrogenase subunit E2 [Jiella sp. MQZ9-1]|uniref:Dihydrolipoamide acetyltransferase component of pyruvate dehydrogenase complex n=1 Tax=Jiella flava TaxID=2816857 RepID=A0A939G2J1_9HYPH|nr:dihydrolipoamide acetyltransferase family protein [Jiella flava]MBO0664037.1 2-oxo acid dehydrogenase subunit E2 [Jiella flava]MCD2472609.1 2-oxo acid dehydrogenase subunit E2 [Jiella flava]
MGTVTIRLPDVGEGVAEAELVEWHVEVGDPVKEDMTLAAVMTDKATVDIPSPVDGTVNWLAGAIGDTIAVGSPLVKLEVDGPGGTEPEANPQEQLQTGDDPSERPSENIAPAAGDQHASQRADKTADDHFRSTVPPPRAPQRKAGEKPLAAPAVRRRAMEAGIDLRRVAGSGPAGRILADDLDAYLEAGDTTAPGRAAMVDTTVTEVKIAGLRRRIAEKMETASRRIAHITYVDEIDMEAVEQLRAAMNKDRRDDRPKLTLLPFLMKALVIAVREQPVMNALYDDEAGILHQHGGVHIGVAAQTGSGLMVPVARHCEARDIWSCAGELARLSEAAKAGTAKREELSGSTITITSLGALGGIATTPIINHPEVAIIGVNKMEVRPVWDGSQFVPRRRMNLSSSFDHRVIDGYDAAVFVQRIKTLLETPAMIFVEASA